MRYLNFYFIIISVAFVLFWALKDKIYFLFVSIYGYEILFESLKIICIYYSVIYIYMPFSDTWLYIFFASIIIIAVNNKKVFFLPPGLNLVKTDCDISSSDESASEGHISQFIELNIHDTSIPRADPINLIESPNRPCSPLPASNYALQSQDLHSSLSPHGIAVSANGDGFEIADLGYGLCSGEVKFDLTAPTDPLPNLSVSLFPTQTNPVLSFSNVVNSFQMAILTGPVSRPNQSSASLTSTPTNVHATPIPDALPHSPSPIIAPPSRVKEPLPSTPDLAYLRSKAERSHSASDWLYYLKFAACPGSIPEQRYQEYKLAFLVIFNKIISNLSCYSFI